MVDYIRLPISGGLPLEENIGAGDRSRTYDLLITNQLLYQLSYTSSEPVMLVQAEPDFKHHVTINYPNVGLDLHYLITITR